ncbi:MAG: VanW family protein [Clostridia bacterium]|nr:VanW family protein [Clostridia bacterium]
MRTHAVRWAAALALLLSCLLAVELSALASAEPPALVEEQELTEFIGIAGKKLKLHRSRDAKSPVLRTIPSGTELDVIEKGRKWTKVLYDGAVGFTDTKFTERVQRRDPFGGNMPGVSTHVALARVLEDTSFVPPGRKAAVKLTAGTYMSVAQVREEKGEERAFFPYMRLDRYASVPMSKLALEYFVPWERAQPGDLIYAFTTFYSTSRTERLNEGRMANIALACERLDGVIVGAGEVFSFNEICAPYTQENGYHRAPILSGTADSGFGGGTCQVNSTLYNIVLRVPAVIVEMNWHAQAGVKYLPAGFDATVGARSDMRFRNVLPYAVRIGFAYGDGVMTALLYRASE